MSPATARGRRAACRCGCREPSSGGDTVLVPRVGVERLVEILRLLAERRRRPQVEELGRAAAATRPHGADERGAAVAGRSRPRQSGQRTRASSRSGIIGRRRSWATRESAVSDERLEAAGAPIPTARARSARGRGPASRRAQARASAMRSLAECAAGQARARSPGVDEQSHRPRSCSTSRIDGRSDATIGRPAAMYSNSLSGDVNRVEIADAGFGQHEHVGRRELARRRAPGARGR